MKAILIKNNDSLRSLFGELAKQLSNMNPENSNSKVKLLFKKELFYEIEPSQRIPSWVDVNFKFTEPGSYAEQDISLSIPPHFFIKYEDLSKENLSLFDKSELLKIKDYAESLEDFELCIDIRNML